MDQNLLDLLPKELKNISDDSMDIILNRTLLRIYQNLTEEEKAKMAEIFNSGTDEEKRDFLNTHFKNFQKILIEETQKLMEELKEMIK